MPVTRTARPQTQASPSPRASSAPRATRRTEPEPRSRALSTFESGTRRAERAHALFGQQRPAQRTAVDDAVARLTELTGLQVLQFERPGGRTELRVSAPYEPHLRARFLEQFETAQREFSARRLPVTLVAGRNPTQERAGDLSARLNEIVGECEVGYGVATPVTTKDGVRFDVTIGLHAYDRPQDRNDPKTLAMIAQVRRYLGAQPDVRSLSVEQIHPRTPSTMIGVRG